MSRPASCFASRELLIPITEPAYWVAPVMALSLVLIGLRAFAGV